MAGSPFRLARFTTRLQALAALTLVALTLAAPALEAGKRKAKQLYTEGRRAELTREYDRALELYEQAWQEYPEDHRYELSVRRLRFVAGQAHVDAGRRLRDQGLYEEAVAEFERAIALDPASTVANQQLRRTLDLIEKIQKRDADGDGQADSGPVKEDRDITASAIEIDRDQREEMVQSLKEPARLEPLSNAPIDIVMSEQSGKVYETIGKLAGINVLMDPDYTSKKIDVAIQNATLYEALDYVALRSKTFWKPISHNAIFVTDDNANKRREYEEEIVKTIYLNNVATPQELQEIVTAIRGLTDIRRMFPVSSMNALILRGTAAKLALAEKVVHDIDKARPEVIIDVLVLEASKSKTRDLGFSPTAGSSNGISIPFVFDRNRTVDDEGDGSGSVRLGELGGISTRDWVTTLPNGQLTALFSRSDTNLLQSPRIRVSDNQQASLRIGDRIPIATGSFQPGVGGVGVNPLVNTQFQFTDVGVNVDIQPKVHNDREVSMHVALEISNVREFVDLGGVQQPVIGQRTIEHDVRLEEGEASILGGLNQSQLFKTKSGVPFLSDIPILGKLFSISQVDDNENEILIVLIPHIVRLPTIEETNLKSIASGTDQIFEVRYNQASNGKAPLPAVGEAIEPKPQPPAAAPTPEPARPTPTPTPVEQPAADAPAPPAADNPPAAAPAEPDAPPTPAQGAALTLAPSQPTLGVGQEITVDVQVGGADQLFGVPIRINYDREKLELLEVVKGDFLAGDEGTDLIFSRNIRNQVGQAAVNISRFPGTGGATGSGGLITLRFRGLAAGAADIRVVPTGARNAQAQVVNIAAGRTTVTVQ